MDNGARLKLQELFVSYTQNLPKKIHAIERQWEYLSINFDQTLLQDFHRNIHSLCGSAGTYGYGNLSKRARDMEIYLKSILDVSTLSTADIEQINHYLQLLKQTLSDDKPEIPAYLSTVFKLNLDNKLIYLLEQNAELTEVIIKNMENIGYSVQLLDSFEQLLVSINHERPVAIILDTDFLTDEAIDAFTKIDDITENQIQLFCLLPNAELLPRLKAVRAGCNAFFQKPIDIYHLTKVINQNCSLTQERAYRILIVDDSESLAAYYSLILSQVGMITRTVSDPMELLKEIGNFYPDLLLMDIYMPQCTGIELATILRQESNYTKIPIIFMSTEDDKRKQISAMDAGGDDFLTKPISPQLLISTVNTRSKRAGILNHYMDTDSLTGLLNHSTILKRLEFEIEMADKKNYPVLFVMVDIDHFKTVNDTFGHPVGDAVIKKLALLLTTRFRATDVVGRYGGEEFAIVLPNTTLELGMKICDDLRKLFSQQLFTHYDQNFYCTLSAGIAQHAHEKNVVAQADQALYVAKKAGRNRVVIFN